MTLSLSFFLLLFIIAFLYASVGHGGASGYLALMAIFSFDPNFMKPTALILNLFVSLVSFTLFFLEGHFKWKLFLPFALASIPFSFLGGMISLDGDIYKKVLGLTLLIPVIKFFVYPNTNDSELKKNTLALTIIIGASIGFLSGLIGIGGGILLSPILLMLHWSNQKQTAAISALFIFVNSVSGLAGQLSKGVKFENDMLTFVAVAFIGGILGAWLGAKNFNQSVLKYILATALLVASIKLLFT
ncbi:sulfite exporter TauE/SafE family protein [Flavobacterium yafengii]|uniref:sulfite exporter TauE/SafE family protein n=1 Tax=Flavobacterium yafengii TaxID=3041253 RepID=UPI0024A8DB52|nr:sulfite exporter TauE/SafE family protein [Flavobacterium yafengii]MDI5897199.1 sulfite exporter TauE/SafE family protein [Flavobacterium yafengii]